MYDLASFKILFDERLTLFLQSKKQACRLITASPTVGEIVAHSMRLSINGGKRIRPYLGYLGYVASGGRNSTRIIDALVGLELFHVFALIHDDIIDRASSRRGVPTVDAHMLRSLRSTKDAKHKATAQAILAGDLVYGWAHEALFTRLTQTQCREIMPLFYTMIEEVIIGQMIDVAIVQRLVCPDSLLEEKNVLKTARYTFVHPLKIGAALAGNMALNHFFESFGKSVGTAFQMHDDILDIVGDFKKTGKKRFMDITEGQHTHMTNYVRAHGTLRQKKILDRCFGRRLTGAQRRELDNVFASSGTLAYGRREISKRMNAARRMVSDARLSHAVVVRFEELLDLLEGRVV